MEGGERCGSLSAVSVKSGKFFNLISFFTHSNGVAALDLASDRNSACLRCFP